MDYKHDTIIELQLVAASRDGRAFRAFDLSNIGAASVVYYLLTVGDSPIELHGSFLSTSTSTKTVMSLFYDTTDATGGTPVSVVSTNGLSTKTSKTTITRAPTITTEGVLKNMFVLFGTDAQGSQVDEGDRSYSLNYSILPPLSKVLLKVDNAGGATDFFMKVFFSEFNPNNP